MSHDDPTTASRTAQAWRRLPVVFRAVVVGFLVLLGGNAVPQALLAVNLATLPAVPWSVLLILVYLRFYWRYLSGHGWPRSTLASRSRDLRVVPLSPKLWRWSLTAGGLWIASLTALTYALSRVLPLGLALPDALRALPVLTLASIATVVSIVAGVAEEAAFRGYMQGPIERRHGAVVGVLVTSAVFVLAHLNTADVTVPRMVLIFIASVGYGVLARITGSILPGVVLHAAGDIASFSLLFWVSRARAGTPPLPPPGWNDSLFLLYCVETLILAGLTAWAFRRLVGEAKGRHAAQGLPRE